ncbi:MAG TPA: hypothetical protein VNO30_06880 [Kofleriaceae bacterium]|nr:hypothetical protein [Kofleriaceae bacterium]
MKTTPISQLAALLAALFAASLAAACTGDDTAPSASVVSAAPDRIIPSDDTADDLVITVAYGDGDGDLGGGTAEVHDCRADGLLTALPLPQIAPESVIGEPIKGTLELHVNDIGAIAAGAPPAACRDLGIEAVDGAAAVFCVILVDAAGHAGDGDCTQPIALAIE